MEAIQKTLRIEHDLGPDGLWLRIEADYSVDGNAVTLDDCRVVACGGEDWEIQRGDADERWFTLLDEVALQHVDGRYEEEAMGW